MEKMLTIKQERFAQEYIVLGNASEAYRRVYNADQMTDEAIHVSASRLKAKVWLRIKELQVAEAEKYAMSRSEVLNMWTQIATADVNEVIQVRRKGCVKCDSEQHQFQPNALCQSCGGEGEPYVYVNDTRQLKGSARLLYAGARKTREGVEVILRDQDAALVNIARAIGLFDETSQKPAKELQTDTLSLKGVTDPNEASKIYQLIMKG